MPSGPRFAATRGRIAGLFFSSAARRQTRRKGLGRIEYRFAEYEYDEIRCEAANEKITEDEELRHQHTRFRIRSQQTENRSLGGMPQAPGWLA
jgi:hypothetical protein